MAIDALIVTYDPDKHIVLVGRKTAGQFPDIVNAFEGEDADYIYRRLLIKKEVEKNGDA